MDSNEVVDLSSDDGDTAVIRKESDRQKWNELKKYIPFLEYISKKDPEKNATYTKLLHWLKIRAVYPARVAYMCETRIRKRYEKLKLTMDFPPHVVSAFKKLDAIVISDEDETQDLEEIRASEKSTKVSNSQTKAKGKVSDNAGLFEKNSSASSVANCKTKETNIDVSTVTDQSVVSSSKKSDKNKQTNVASRRSCLLEIPEDGELLSDNEGGISKKQSKSDDTSSSKGAEKPKTTETADDILNNELFKRIDSLTEDGECRSRNGGVSFKALQSTVEVQAQKSPVLQQNNLERVLPRRRSPLPPLQLLLSPVSDDDDSSRTDTQRKKKKKKKKKKKSKHKSHRTSDWYISEAENADGDRALRQKISRRDCHSPEDDDKTEKRNKCDKMQKEKSKPLYIISDDDDDDADEEETAKKSPNITVPESQLFQRRDPDRDTVVLLDSDDDDQPQSTVVSQPSNQQTITTLPFPFPKADSPPIIENKGGSNPSTIGDLNNMDLEELSDVYSKLCQTTGIQLEELLSDLVTKSTNVEEQAPVVCLDQFNQKDIFSDNANNNNNNMMCIEADFEQQHNQKLEQQNHHLQQQQHELLQRQQQHHQQQMQQADQMLCNVPQPQPYTYQNRFLLGLNLKDPRIVQKLKQIQDSPIYNLGTRESAKILVNLHSPCPQRRPNPIAKVTAKTATTYGEHKRLRELEKQNQLDHKNADKCTVVTRDHIEAPPLASEQASPSAKRCKSKRSNSAESGSGNETSKERKRAISSGSESGRKTPESGEKDNARRRTNSTGSEGGRKTSKSNEKQELKRKNSAASEEGRTTPKSSENARPMREHSSGSESGRNTRKPSQSEAEKEDEDITRTSFSLNRSKTLRIESDDSSDEDASLPTTSAVSPSKKERVVDIVLSAMNKTKNNAEKALRSLTRTNSMIKSTHSNESNQQHTAAVSKVSANERIREATAEKGHSPGGKRRRPKSIDQSPSTPKTNNAQKRGCRELNNLNCTFKDYREMFEKNCLPTHDGKRRCIVPKGSMMEPQLNQSEENLLLASDKSNDIFEPQQKVTAAPIKRRRQTCSALQRSSTPEKIQLPPLKVVIRRLSAAGTFSIEESPEISNASDDTDEFDVEEHRKPTPPKIKDSIVMLRKLSQSDIEELKSAEKKNRKNSFDYSNSTSKHPKPVEHNRLSVSSSESTLFVESTPQEMPILVPYTSKLVDIPTKTAPKPPKYSNVDIGMTLSATKTCTLCNKRPLDLTNHYVVQHKTESYVSRLSSAEIEDLEANITLAVPYRKRYKVVCVFCQDELEDQFVCFHDHYSYHTGEYAYKCDVCELMKPYRPDVRSHQLRTSRCRNGKIRVDYRYKQELTVIYLYVCKLCNFVQLNEANIHKHHRDHHGFRFDEPHHVKKCIIAAVDSTEVANEVMPSNSQEDNFAEENENISAADSETRQPQEFVHEHPLDIKDVLLTQDGQTGENQTIKLEGYAISPSLSLFESLLDDMNRDNEILESESVASPEVLLEQLHCSQTSSSVMTVVHSNTATVPFKDNHKPYVDPVDVKPNVNDIQIEPAASQTPSAKVKTTQSRTRTYRCTLSESGYFGMYKCMFQDCWFSTNKDTSFIQHTSSHTSNSSFRCAYCGSKNSSAEKLVRHVRSRHSMSRYQCSDCTYRSVIPGNVSIHRGLCHSDSTNAKGIYECVFRLKTKEERVLELQNKLINNITSLKCPDCSSTFYAVSSMKMHIQAEHPQSFDTLDTSMFNEFACLHCKTESNSKESMQIHLATVHPDEMGYVAERKLKSYASHDSIENISMVNISKLIMPVDIHLAEFVEPDPEPEPKVAATDEQALLEESSPQPTESTFSSLISIPLEEEQPENIETEQALNTANSQKEEDLLRERMKLLLDLLTENTGINQSVLYRCTQCTASFFKYEFWLTHMTNRHSITDVISCPYCNQHLALDSVVPHFESHSRHQYFCLHCIKTFCSHDQVQEHFTTCHKDCPKFSQKKLKTGLRTYYIIQKHDVPIVDWIPVYKIMSDEIRANLIARLQENTQFEWWEGLDLACLEEIQIPQFIEFGQQRYKCLVKSCRFVGLEENELDSHLITHTIPRQYKCSHCVLKMTSPTWEDMKNHKMLHKDNVYICCVCKYLHHNRCGITRHIESLHNSRDVPVITMWRDERNYKTSLSIVLTTGRTGFKTTVVCFCCEKSMKNNSELLLHLKAQHKIKMCPKCAHCDKVLLTQPDAEEHSKEHGPQIFKLRYDILTTGSHNVNVKSLAPFLIEIKLQGKRTSEEDEEFSLKKVKLEPPINVEDEIVIKTELDEDAVPDDADNSQRAEGAIKCVNINQLVQNVDASTAQEVNRRPEVGRILVKPTAALQMPAQYAGYSPASHQPAQVLSRTTSSGMHQSEPEQVVANIQLPSHGGTAVVSTPSLASYTVVGPSLPTVLPVNPTSRMYPDVDDNLWIANYSRQMNLPIPNLDKMVDGPHDARTCNCPTLPEIAVTCKHCMKECTDFCELRTHYDEVHAPRKQRFLFRIARKVECMHCSHRCSLRALVVHHVTFHPNLARMCRSVLDRTRCGFCNMVFDFLPTSERSICACPMNQRVLSDCLDLKTFKALQMYGVKSYKISQSNNGDSLQKLELIKTISYLCNVCDRMETGMQQIIEHYRNSHIKSSETFATRVNHYKKIGTIYPRGLILDICDGGPQTFNYDYFQQDIKRIETQMKPPCK